MASEKQTSDCNIRSKVVKIEDADRLLNTKNKAKNNAYMFGKAFGERLRTDKMFLLSFFITIVFLCLLGYKMLRDSKSDYPTLFSKIMDTKKDDVQKSESSSSVSVEEKLDVSDKLGFYSREVSLADPIKINDSCTIDSYKYIYQIKKDNTIIKYFSSCAGNFKIWSDKLVYVSVGDTKYIGTNDIHFLFSLNKLKEADGDTFDLDEDISSIKEKKLVKDLSLSFIDNSIIFSTYNDLYLLRGNTVLFDLNEEFPNNGGNLDRYVYGVDEKNYKFIRFSNAENLNCYTDSDLTEPVYKIYSIAFDKDKLTFGNPKEIVSRNKNDNCSNFESDLEILKK